jgi:hypothetical protein
VTALDQGLPQFGETEQPTDGEFVGCALLPGIEPAVAGRSMSKIYVSKLMRKSDPPLSG